MKKVLAISGGGMRGIIPVEILLELERRIDKKIAHQFDLIAGTSTGGILACCLTSTGGISLSDIQSFYYDSGKRIFRSGLRKLTTLGGLSGAKYDVSILLKELHCVLGEANFSEVATNLLIPLVDANNVDAVFAKSWTSFWSSAKMYDVACGTSAAQTYFNAHEFIVNENKYRFIDGGNFCNNPTASALFEARNLWPDEHLLVVHIGCGRVANPKALPDGGLAVWAPYIYGTMSECQDDVAKYLAKSCNNVTFIDIETYLEKNVALDDASDKSLNYLRKCAREAIHSLGSKQGFDQLTSLLGKEA